MAPIGNGLAEAFTCAGLLHGAVEDPGGPTLTEIKRRWGRLAFKGDRMDRAARG